jgi:hypothetical protein
LKIFLTALFGFENTCRYSKVSNVLLVLSGAGYSALDSIMALFVVLSLFSVVSLVELLVGTRAFSSA